MTEHALPTVSATGSSSSSTTSIPAASSGLVPPPSSSSSTSTTAIPQPNGNSKPWRSKSTSSKHTAPPPTGSTSSSSTSGSAVMQPAKLEKDASSKVVAQRSMLEKLKLFNSKGSSKSTSSTSNGTVVPGDRAEAGSNTDPLEEDQGNARPGANGTGSSTPPTTATSPKMALRGIAQRTFSRALTSKKASVKGAEKEKEKEKGKRPSVTERTELRGEEPKEETVDTADGSTRKTSKISSLIPKGGKVSKKEATITAAAAAAAAHSGIPKPGAKAERPRSGRMGLARTQPPGDQRDSRYSSSTSSLASNEGKRESGAAPVAGGGSTTQSTASNTVSVQLPQNQQHHSHPNTATVAPFMYR